MTSSVPLFCRDVIELSAAANVGSTARPKKRKVPTTCWPYLICSGVSGGELSVRGVCGLVEPYSTGGSLIW